MLIAVLWGWQHREQGDVITLLREENRAVQNAGGVRGVQRVGKLEREPIAVDSGTPRAAIIRSSEEPSRYSVAMNAQL